MHPIDHYTTIRRGQEELLRRAEYERMLRAVRVKSRAHQQVRVAFANWLGRHLVSWGQRLEHLETLSERQHAPSPAPHH